MIKYRVGLIGLGQIAAGYGTPGEVAPYCHAGGLAQSTKVQLVAATEPFEKAQQSFIEKWGATFVGAQPPIAFYSQTEVMLAEAELDIVGVCVRGPLHYSMVRQILLSPAPPRSIFLEKPPFCSLQEADEIVGLAASKGVTITVSYSRHWAPHVLKLAELVREGLIGRVHSVVGYCGGTVLSFASHTTDLICQFASAQSGVYDPIAVTEHGIDVEEHASVPPEFVDRGFEPEPNLKSVSIEFASGVTGLQIGQCGEFDQFYVEVFGEKGRVRAGMYLPPAAFDRDNQPIDLSLEEFPEPTSVFQVAYDQIADHLAGGSLPDCSGANWVKVNEIGFAAIESGCTRKRVTLPNVNRARRVFADG